MAIDKPNFSNIGNYNSGTTIKKRTSTSGDEGPNRLQHYINDDSFNKNYKEFIGTMNPAYQSLSESDSGVNEGFHTQKFVNKFKTCDIIISSGTNWPTITDKRWGHWRNYFKDIHINDKVFLDPDVRKLDFSYELKYASIWEEVLKLKALSAIDSAARDARLFTGTQEGHKIFIPIYKETPAFTGSTPLSVPSSMKFNFQFGQAGLFSGEEEVYKPILALAMIFAPSVGNGGGSLIDTPATSLEQQMADIGQTMINNGDVLVKGIKNVGAGAKKDLASMFNTKSDPEPDESASADNKDPSKSFNDNMVGKNTAIALTNLQEQIYKSISEGIQKNLGQTKTLCVRLGRITLPPMIVHSVAWSFDTTQVDEYGFPFQGSIEFGGLETAKLTTKGDLKMIDN